MYRGVGGYYCCECACARTRALLFFSFSFDPFLLVNQASRVCMCNLRVAHEVETDSATFNSNSGCSSSKDSNHDGSTLQAKGEDGDDDNDVDLNHRTSSSAEAAADAQALWQLEQRLRSSCNAPFAFLLLGGAACGMSSCYLALPWASFIV